jgi:hypothetical protein
MELSTYMDYMIKAVGLLRSTDNQMVAKLLVDRDIPLAFSDRPTWEVMLFVGYFCEQLDV